MPPVAPNPAIPRTPWYQHVARNHKGKIALLIVVVIAYFYFRGTSSPTLTESRKKTNDRVLKFNDKATEELAQWAEWWEGEAGKYKEKMTAQEKQFETTIANKVADAILEKEKALTVATNLLSKKESLLDQERAILKKEQLELEVQKKSFQKEVAAFKPSKDALVKEKSAFQKEKGEHERWKDLARQVCEVLDQVKDIKADSAAIVNAKARAAFLNKFSNELKAKDKAIYDLAKELLKK